MLHDPEAGELWTHRNGNVYKVLMLTNIQLDRQDKYPTTVVYQNISNDAKYSRKLSDWHRSMSEGRL